MATKKRSNPEESRVDVQNEVEEEMEEEMDDDVSRKDSLDFEKGWRKEKLAHFLFSPRLLTFCFIAVMVGLS
jgi:hypothetical protein